MDGLWFSCSHVRLAHKTSAEMLWATSIVCIFLNLMTHFVLFFQYAKVLLEFNTACLIFSIRKLFVSWCRIDNWCKHHLAMLLLLFGCLLYNIVIKLELFLINWVLMADLHTSTWEIHPKTVESYNHLHRTITYMTSHQLNVRYVIIA